MSAKKWMVLFPLSILLCLVLIFTVNVLADPFGVFGDPLMDWYAYDMTNNPRAAKVAYLEAHSQEYDSYVIGSSSSASYDPAELNDYTGGKFFNFFVYGCDTADYRLYAKYAVEQCGAKRIILNLGLNETNEWLIDHSPMGYRNHRIVTGENPLTFYGAFGLNTPKYAFEKLQSHRDDSFLPKPFDVFVPESGCYDKRVRDVERINDPAAYEALHGEDFQPETCEMAHIRECVDSVAYIKDLCDQNGVELTVICSPIWEGQWQGAPREKMEAYKKALAQVTDFWDFSHSPISYDSRYFYDATHFRNDVGSMVLARVYGNEDRYLPEDFGVYVTADNVEESLDRLYAAQPDREQVCVPTLMYHHLAEEGNGTTILSLENFERQLDLLVEHGFHAVSLQQMVDYVQKGTPLPEKPICITFDDGYASNYQYAWPMLAERDLKGTIFTIGVSVGKDVYKDTDHAMHPHFTWEQAREMQESGVMDVQSHTYDMHQWPPFEDRPEDQCRRAMAPLAGETEAEFIAAVKADTERFAAEFAANSLTPLIGLAYPTGVHGDLTEVLLHDSGIQVTFSILNDQRNCLVKGLDQSLYALCRLDVTDEVTDEAFLAHLNNRP